MAGKGIVPKSKAPGVDICGISNLYYFIRSDLGLFMEVENLQTGEGINIYKLHPSCTGGDHYFADNNWFYIIKGNSCRMVKNLETDKSAHIIDVHPHFLNGDHYCGGDRHYYLDQKELKIHVADSIERPTRRSVNYLYFTDGLYYWMLNEKLNFVTYDEKWGVQLKWASIGSKFLIGLLSLHPNIVNFLPGGLSLNYGPARGIWVIIKTITNNTASSMKWSKKITKKVGYNREKMSSLEHHWKLSASASLGVGDETSLVKAQFSFSAEYGGRSLHTTTESWNEATETVESCEFNIEAQESLYVWQYTLKLGEVDVVVSRDMHFSNNPEPPTKVPLTIASLQN